MVGKVEEPVLTWTGAVEEGRNKTGGKGLLQRTEVMVICPRGFLSISLQLSVQIQPAE